MKLDNDAVKKIRGLIVFTGVIILLVVNINGVIDLFNLVLAILVPFLIGGAIAFVLNIPMSFFERNIFQNKKTKDKKWAKKMARPFSLIIAIAVIIFILWMALFIIIPQLTKAVISLADNLQVELPQMFAQAEQYFSKYPAIQKVLQQFAIVDIQWDNILGQIGDFLKGGFTDAVSSTFSFATAVASGVVNAVIGIVFACYILLSKEKLSVQATKFLYAFVPKRFADSTLDVLTLIYQTFRSFVTGQGLEALCLGLLFGVTLTIFRMPYALLIAILTAICSFIPIFGAIIACVLGAFMLLAVSPVQALVFVIMDLVLQQIDGNLMYPKIVGNSIGLPPMYVLLAVTVGGSLFGIVGMLTFIPITSVFYTLLRGKIYKELKKKALVVTKEGEIVREEHVKQL